MKTVFCDLCRQQLTEEEVEDTVCIPSAQGLLTMYPMIYLDNRRIDACWRCMAEQLLAVAPPRQPAS
jgi:hypothetical protein